jgi:hypothetical protein
LGSRRSAVSCHERGRGCSPGQKSIQVRVSFLAFIPNACSLRVVGWSMATHLTTELVVALQMPIARRKPLRGLCAPRSEGCSTHTSLSFGKRLEDEGPVLSRGELVRRTTTPWPRALCGHAEDGASLPQQLAHPLDGEQRHLRVHSGLLQKPGEPLRARASKP